MMKHNVQSFWSIPFMLLFLLVAHFLVEGRILPGFWIFLIIVLLLSSIALLWGRHYFSSLENTLHKFSSSYGGTVEFIKAAKESKIVCYDAKGNYYGRAFHINTERLRLKGNHQMMNVRLKMDSPVIASLKLKRKPWGKIDHYLCRF